MKKNIKGVILAGGTGSRLFPITKVFSKQLLPVYNKPMILLSLGLMVSIGIKEILIIVTKRDLILFKRLLGNGKEYNCKITYKVQLKPAGIAQAITLAKSHFTSNKILLMLGDNFLFGSNLKNVILDAISSAKGASIFTYKVKSPERYGVLNIKNNKIINIVEKPKRPTSNKAIPGIYIYDQKSINYVKNLKPSNRGELEITDLNNLYLKKNDLEIFHLGDGIIWMDMGTFDSYLEASQFIAATEKRQGFEIYDFIKNEV
jgi:glucose-1-phosphate thymidylyltransferase